MEKVSVLHGSFTDISLVDLLQVISIGRQYMTVELQASTGDLVGALLLKSGMLLDARTPREHGKNAFFLLLGEPRAESFTVFRLVGSLQAAAPLGRIDSLVLESAAEPRPTAVVEPVAAVHTAPAPTPEAAPPAPPAPQPAPRPPEAPVPHPSAPRGRIIAVGSPKGGVGKTTLTLNLGVALAERGLSVLLVDADPMGGLGDSLTRRVREAAGVYEVLTQRREFSSCLVRTRIERLRVLPAGQWPPDDGEGAWQFPAPVWNHLLETAARTAEVVLVDTAAGLQGVTTQVLRHCDDILGVLQAEVLGGRAFNGLLKFLEQFAGQERPRLGGIVVNMFQYQDDVSHTVVHDALKTLPPDIVMQPLIPRDPVLLEASTYGVPVAFLKRSAPANLAGIFESLAADLSLRLGVGHRPERGARPFVD